MQCYHVRFALLTPAQFGAGSLGMIEKTECFIPGRILWGALTNTLANLAVLNPDDSVYCGIGNEIKKESFSTFFPMLLPDAASIQTVKFVPCFRSAVANASASDLKDFFWRAYADPRITLSVEDVESQMLFSTTSTSISQESYSAERGSLHATDMVSPFILTQDSRRRIPMCFDGFMTLPDSIPVRSCSIPLSDDLLKDAFSKLALGGNRSKGNGRVKLTTLEKVDKPKDTGEIIEGDVRIITVERPVEDKDNAFGRARLNSFREYDPETGSGRRFSSPQLVWQVGTVLYKVFDA